MHVLGQTGVCQFLQFSLCHHCAGFTIGLLTSSTPCLLSAAFHFEPYNKAACLSVIVRTFTLNTYSLSKVFFFFSRTSHLCGSLFHRWAGGIGLHSCCRSPQHKWPRWSVLSRERGESLVHDMHSNYFNRIIFFPKCDSGMNLIVRQDYNMATNF